MQPKLIFKPIVAAGVLAAASLAADAQDAEPAASMIPETCAAATCFAVGVSPDADAALGDEDGATLAELAGGLVLSYRGDEPVYARLIASRFDRGRLVRYGVSPRVEFTGDGAPLDAAVIEEVLTDAFRPVTEPTVAARSMAAEGAETTHEVAVSAFIGATPFTNLAGADGAGLISIGGEEDVTETPYGGSVGVIAIVPEMADLRDGAAAQTFGTVVALEHP